MTTTPPPLCPICNSSLTVPTIWGYACPNKILDPFETLYHVYFQSPTNFYIFYKNLFYRRIDNEIIGYGLIKTDYYLEDKPGPILSFQEAYCFLVSFYKLKVFS